MEPSDRDIAGYVRSAWDAGRTPCRGRSDTPSTTSWWSSASRWWPDAPPTSCSRSTQRWTNSDNDNDRTPSPPLRYPTTWKTSLPKPSRSLSDSLHGKHRSQNRQDHRLTHCMKNILLWLCTFKFSIPDQLVIVLHLPGFQHGCWWLSLYALYQIS